MSLQDGTTRPPTRVTRSGYNARCLRSCSFRLFSSGGRALRERAEFGEDAHQQLLAALHLELAIDAPQIRVHGVGRQPQAGGGVFLGIAVEDGAHDAALARREAETGGERTPLAGNEHRLAGSSRHGLSHGVPICCALRSHRQTGPSSGSTTGPTCAKPHFASTRVEAFASGRVCARMVFTRGSLPAK